MKKIMYSIIALVSAFSLPSEVMANDEESVDVQYLVIQQGDGSENRFALKDYPEITFVDGVLKVETQERSIEVSLADVANYGFETVKEPVSTSIGTIEQKPSATPSFSYGNAEFRGLAAGSMVMVYGINGNVLGSVKADAEGRAKIDTSSLPKGIVILRSSGKSVKIICK